MAKFDDYHRTVVGYHGTGLGTALRIVTRIENFRWSERDYDWLGGGVYFVRSRATRTFSFAFATRRASSEPGFNIRRIWGWVMSVKRSEFPVSESVWRIRKARKMLERMSKQERIELAVEAGVMTREQADRAKQRLAEIETEEAGRASEAPAR